RLAPLAEHKQVYAKVRPFFPPCYKIGTMLTSEQKLILSTVQRFVEKEVMPVASGMEHRNEYPHELVAQMRQMGLFGLNVPEEFGGAGVDYTTFAMIFEELA